MKSKQVNIGYNFKENVTLEVQLSNRDKLQCIHCYGL